MKKSEFPAFFGDWLKQRRKILDLTQEELAQRAGCSVFALRKIESGDRRPSKQLAEWLAKALEIPEETQQTFIRSARGELNLDRLPPPSLVPDPILKVEAPSYFPNQLPGYLTPLIGREMELSAMARIFNEPQCRLLTLTGLGGMGKTRLAVEFATTQLPNFPGGIYYVPLAPLDSSELIVSAIADALHIVFSGPSDPKEQLIQALETHLKQAALFVLDNMEHLLPLPTSPSPKLSPTALLVEMLQHLPHAKFLITSRERLNLQGEWTYELYGLPSPPPVFLERFEEYSAPTLFLQNARRTRADFTITKDEQRALVRICHLLEGIPLALELAATWVGMLSCDEIADEIESNIDFLSTSMRDIPERHRSLKATFNHSWRLLSDAERDTLSRLSIFRGGFDRPAAHKVAEATLPMLLSLVSKSLVRRMESGRYDLHEVIRQYAMAQLDQDESRCIETCARHSEYYLRFAAEHERKLKSAAQQESMRDMTIEVDNLRVAWNWGIRHGNFESLHMAVRSFGWYFEVSGLIQEGIEQLDLLVRVLKETPRDQVVDKTLGLTFVQQGLLCFRSGQFVCAQELYEDAIALLRQVNDHALLADALIFCGTLMYLNGEYLEAKQLIEEGLAYARETNNPWFTAFGIYNLGHVDSLIGDYQKGYDQMQEGLSLWRELGDPHSISLGLNFLVETQIALGRHDEAIAAMHESIALCERTKNRWGIATAYRYLGLAVLATGKHDEAREHLQKSLELFGDNFKGWDIAQSLVYLGEATMVAGNLMEAENIFREAMSVAYAAKANPLILDALMGLAEINASAGDCGLAAQLTFFVQNHELSSPKNKNVARRLISKIEKRLSASQLQPIQGSIENDSLQTMVQKLRF